MNNHDKKFGQLNSGATSDSNESFSENGGFVIPSTIQRNSEEGNDEHNVTEDTRRPPRSLTGLLPTNLAGQVSGNTATSQSSGNKNMDKADDATTRKTHNASSSSMARDQVYSQPGATYALSSLIHREPRRQSSTDSHASTISSVGVNKLPWKHPNQSVTSIRSSAPSDKAQQGSPAPTVSPAPSSRHPSPQSVSAVLAGIGVTHPELQTGIRRQHSDESNERRGSHHEQEPKSKRIRRDVGPISGGTKDEENEADEYNESDRGHQERIQNPRSHHGLNNNGMDQNASNTSAIDDLNEDQHYELVTHSPNTRRRRRSSQQKH